MSRKWLRPSVLMALLSVVRFGPDWHLSIFLPDPRYRLKISIKGGDIGIERIGGDLHGDVGAFAGARITNFPMLSGFRNTVASGPEL